MLNVRFVAFDLETTGLSTLHGGKIIEIGAVLIESNKIIDEFHSLINIERSIPKKISKINGITSEMLQGQPKMVEVIPVFLEFIKDSTLIAHNARFDIKFLRNELYDHGITLSHSYKCTLEISRKLFPELDNHRLETVARYLISGIPNDFKFHRALDDARLVAKIWIEIKKKILE